MYTCCCQSWKFVTLFPEFFKCTKGTISLQTPKFLLYQIFPKNELSKFHIFSHWPWLLHAHFLLNSTRQNSHVPLWQCNPWYLIPDTVITGQWLHRTYALLGTHYTRAFQPAAHGPHAARKAILCGPWSHIHFNSISWINEIIKPESMVLRPSVQLVHCNC